MARVKKTPPANADIILPDTGMVDIVFKGEIKNVTVQLAKTLIDKGSAKLKV